MTVILKVLLCCFFGTVENAKIFQCSCEKTSQKSLSQLVVRKFGPKCAIIKLDGSIQMTDVVINLLQL